MSPRRIPSFAPLLLCAATAAMPRSAAAGPCDSPRLNTCINAETFWPTAGPTQMMTVAGTQTTARGQISFGLVGDYIRRPVMLRVATPGPGGTDIGAVDDAIQGNFLWAYGVTDRLQLDLAMPVTFYQSGAGASPLTGGSGLRESAFRDMRFGLTYALVPRARVAPASDPERGAGHVWSLASRMAFSAPSGDRGDFSGDRTGVVMPGVAADYRRGIFFAGADVGARLRPVTQFAGARVGSQLTAGLGVGMDVLSKELLSAALEARALYGLAEQHDVVQTAFGTSSTPNGTHIVPAEWALTLRSAPVAAGDVSFHLGGGGPIPLASNSPITVPAFRVLFGLVYAPQGRDTDHDGILDRVDRCPDEAATGAGPRDGCPHPEAGPAESLTPP